MLIFLIIRSNKYTISTFSHLFPYYVLHILDLTRCKDKQKIRIHKLFPRKSG